MYINYTIKETWLHRTNPSFKLLLLIGLFFLVLFTHNLDLLIYLTLGFTLPVILFSGHPSKAMLLYAVPFVLLFISSSTTMMFFGKGTQVWWEWGLVRISEESFFRGLHIGFKSLAFGILGLFFALTTRPVFLFYSLMQQLKLPPRYAYSFMAAIRLLPIMLEEFRTLSQAVKVRGVLHKGWRGLFQKLKMFSIPLLAQSIRRAQRIAVAMEAKRFSQTKNRTYYYKIGVSILDLATLMYFTGVVLAAILLTSGLPIFAVEDVRHYGT